MTATGSVYVRGDGNTVNEPEHPQGDQRASHTGLSELESCAVKVARTVLRGGRSEQSAFPTRHDFFVPPVRLDAYRAAAIVKGKMDERNHETVVAGHSRPVHG